MPLLTGGLIALGVGGGLGAQGALGLSAARAKEAATLAGIDKASELQRQFMADLRASFAPYLAAGKSALDIIQSRIYTSTERKINTAQQRAAIEADIEKYSRPFTDADFPILTGSKASERRQALATQQVAERNARLQEAQSRLSAFDKTQAQLAPFLTEQDAKLNAREARVTSSLERIATLSDFPTSLAGIRSELETDPIYQFRQAEGERAINRAAAARGSFFSGAAIKSLADFSMALTGEETDKSLMRRKVALEAAVTGLSAEVGEQQTGIGNIMSLVNVGANATAGVTGQAGRSTEAQGQLAVGAGAAEGQSAAERGGVLSNVIGQGLQTLGTFGTLAFLPSLLQKPTTTTPESLTQFSGRYTDQPYRGY